MLKLEDLDLSALRGDFSIWLEDTVSHETVTVNPDSPLIAASVIKLGVMLRAFECFENGTLEPGSFYAVKAADKVPSCGALTYMHDGLSVTWLDLVTLMIIVSDNTATNILIRKLDIDRINACLDSYGLTDMRLRRCMFDADGARRGLQNTITARAVARFMRMLLAKQLVSENASAKMLGILSDQQLNGKLPFYLHSLDINVAHKTGEDDGTSHDAGIVFAEHPLICVFLSNNTDVPAFEHFIQDTARQLVI